MRVRDGELIDADQHGAVVYPARGRGAIAAAARRLQARERVIIEAARTPGFDIDKLRIAQAKAGEVD